MTRNNLAVCFSPVIFHLNYDKKLTKQSKQILNNSSSLLSSTNSKPQNTQNQSIKTSSNYNEILKKSPPYQQETSIVLISQIQQAKSNTNSNENLDNVNQLKNDMLNVPENSLDKLNATNISSDLKARLLSVPSISASNQAPSKQNSFNKTNIQQQQQQSTVKSNYRRKYSDRINRAASSIVNFGAELSSSTSSAFFSDSVKDNFENMSKVVQLCVSDMMKYSMDLFTVSWKFNFL